MLSTTVSAGLSIGLSTGLSSSPVDPENGIEWFPLVAGFVGGLALFLYGLRELTDALQRLAGDRLRSVLGRLTTNRVTGLLTGAGVTAVVQSSTVTTVVAVGFVSAGVLGSVQAISVVLGANVGTTVTAQVISLDINTWAFVLVALGGFGVLSARRERWQPQARVLLGLGLLFIGMQIMGNAVAPLRDNESFVDLMARLGSPAYGVLVGASYSALVRSSSAAAALAITMANEQLISLEAGVAIVIGANIGTCITAAMAAIGRPPAAQRVAAAHVAINVIGALAWIGFTGQLADLGRSMSGSDDVARSLANAHTIFNISVAVAMLPLLGILIWVLERWLPDPAPPEVSDRRSALDSGLLSTPALALTAVRVELGRLADALARQIEPAARSAIEGSWNELAAITRADDETDRRYRAIVEYLTDVGQGGLSERRTDELFLLLAMAEDIESLGDALEINLVTTGQRRIEQSVTLDAAATSHVIEVARVVAEAVRLVGHAIASDDRDAARDVIDMKPGLEALMRQAFVDQAGRLVARGTVDLPAFSIERDVLEALHRMFHFAKRAAANEVAGRINEPDRGPA